MPQPARTLPDGTYTIRQSARGACEALLGALPCANTALGLFAADAGDGNQRWRIAYVAGTAGVYTVQLPCGHAQCNQFLSCSGDCGSTTSDMWCARTAGGAGCRALTGQAASSGGAREHRQACVCSRRWQNDGSGRQNWQASGSPVLPHAVQLHS